MCDSNNEISVDGRITVLLLILFGLLVLDFTHRYQWSVFNKTDVCNFSSQLTFVSPDKLVVENCSNTGMKLRHKNIPAIYTPFFFELVPINSAGMDMLMSVKGIGPALAGDIVEYRLHIGQFRNGADLLKLKGIGPKRAAKFSTAFTFNEAP